MKTLLLLLLPLFAFGQNTSAAVSDSINAGLVALSYDTTIQTNDVFRDLNGDLYTYISQISGGQFRAIGPAGVPSVFRFDEAGIIRAWHQYEVDNWILGATGTNYTFIGTTGTGPFNTTITISGDDFTGTGSTESDAVGMAFYHFLIDPDFATYLQ
jgi:hypothetical protein